MIQMKRTLLNLTFVGVGGLLGIVGVQLLPSYAKTERTPPKILVDETAVERDGKFTTSFAPVIKKAAPSVVNIFTTKTVTQRDMRSHPLFNDPMFREFFGDQFRPRGGRARQEQSLGSGVIVSTDGYILTSNHVIEGADEVRVQLPSGREFSATVVGGDSATDTAVLKVQSDSELPAMTLANSDNLEVGDIVLAIGNPFSIGQTVTMGIVSATSRGVGIVDYEDFIQTDASINPGNSGGALVDAQGRLVGINTAILSRSGGNQGVGFAIPVNLSRSIMERLIVDGKVTRGFLGVELQPLNNELAEEFGVKDTGGALVAGVQQGTPAAQAGIKPGDLIVEFNGRKVADNRQLRLMVSQTRPKTKSTFKLLRNGKERTVEVQLAEMPTERTLSGMMRRGSPELNNSSEVLPGVEIGDLDARARRQFNVPQHVRGPVVTSVDPESPAAEELNPGDVILEIERNPVATADEALQLSADMNPGKKLLRVWSRGSAKYVFVDVPEDEENEEPEKEP
jgi:serine protease Do